MAGCSAGAICWFAAGCSNSFCTGRPHTQAGFGWIDAVVCPHYDTEPFRQDAMRATLSEGRVGVGVDQLAAAEVTSSRYRVHSADGSAWAYGCGWSRGRYRVERLEPDGPASSLESYGCE